MYIYIDDNIYIYIYNITYAHVDGVRPGQRQPGVAHLSSMRHFTGWFANNMRIHLINSITYLIVLRCDIIHGIATYCYRESYFYNTIVIINIIIILIIMFMMFIFIVIIDYLIAHLLLQTQLLSSLLLLLLFSYHQST